MQFMTAVKKHEKNSIHLQRDTDFDYNQASNFQKLRYFGFVAKDKKKSGNWLVTRNGGAFLRNEFEIPKIATSFRGRFVEREGKLVKISSYFGNAYTDDYWQENFSYNTAQSNLL